MSTGVDGEQCYAAWQQGDADGNGVIDADEVRRLPPRPSPRADTYSLVVCRRERPPLSLLLLLTLTVSTVAHAV